ncbi:MAG: sugar phosphate isomerase/epimerase family protein [Verrucomicrobiota bacterium]
MKFAICSEIFQEWKPEDMFAYVARTGYDAVEIAPFTIAPYVTAIDSTERSRLRAMADRAGIDISGIHWVLAHTAGFHLTHPDGTVRERTSEYLGSLVDFCADLGGKFMVVGSPKQRNVLEGVTAQQAWDWATEVFRRSVTRAAERGVTICVEPLSPAETNFLNTAAETIRFVRQFDAASLKIILDVKAMSSEAKPIPEIIRESWPHFAYFHANDTNLKGPGFGAVDFRPIGAALRQVSYNGFVSVEVFNFEEGPEIIATKSLACLRETCR